MGNRVPTARRPSFHDVSFKSRLSTNNTYVRSPSRSSDSSGRGSFGGSRSPTMERRSPDWVNGRPPIDSPVGAMPEDEMDRLQQQHYLFLLQFGSNHFAPVDNPSTTLDIGCGTGIWMMEMATEFPDCEFTGIDQVAAQPDDVLPRNCRFVPAEQLAGYLPFGDACFDYVHQRMLVGSVPTDKWGTVCDDIYRVTRPGGWFEILDTDGLIHGRSAYNTDSIDMDGLGLCVDSCDEEADAGEYAATLGPAAERVNSWILAAMERRDVQPEEVFALEPLLHESGFSDIESRRVMVPMGAWGKQPGQMCFESLRGLVHSLKQFLINEGITDELGFNETLRDWQLEADRGRYHIEIVIHWGQRSS